MVANRQQQGGFEEDPLDSPELVRLLERREEAKEDLKPYRSRYLDADKLVKAMIRELELADGTYRAGEFIVKQSEAEEKHIEFERGSSKRISISVAKT